MRTIRHEVKIGGTSPGEPVGTLPLKVQKLERFTPGKPQRAEAGFEGSEDIHRKSGRRMRRAKLLLQLVTVSLQEIRLEILETQAIDQIQSDIGDIAVTVQLRPRN